MRLTRSRARHRPCWRTRSNKLVDEWRNDVAEFARLLPEVSHREPAPSDRDPIPAPYDNAYNKPERNHFHTTIKYHRDDEFFVEHIADDATRRRLDQAWTDLLTSFEYHDANLRFVAKKFALDLNGQFDRGPRPARDRPIAGRAATVRPASEGRIYAMQRRFAPPSRVMWKTPWRSPSEPGVGRSPRTSRSGCGRSTPSCVNEAAWIIRGRSGRCLARILVAPDLPLPRRAAGANEQGIVPLSDRQLASRLSYFLWSSMPDQELRQAAAEGRLHEPRQLERQTRRMLRDPKVRRLATEFFGQWLGFYRFDGYQGIDASRFPEFTDRLKSALYEECRIIL